MGVRLPWICLVTPLNFDITNACLGFVNAMTVASTMIDAGAIDYALIVAGEDPSRGTPVTAVHPGTTPIRPARMCWLSLATLTPRFGVRRRL